MPHVEHAVVEHHRTRHHDEVLVLAVAQHAHLHFLIGLHAAHLLDHARGPASSLPAIVLPSSATMTSPSRRPASSAATARAHAAARARLPCRCAVSICTPSTARRGPPSSMKTNVVAAAFAAELRRTAPRLPAPPCRGARAPRRAWRASSLRRPRASRVVASRRSATSDACRHASVRRSPASAPAPPRSAPTNQPASTFS